MISALLAAALTVVGAMTVFWRDTSVVSAAAEQRLQQLERADQDAQSRIEALQVEMHQVYAMSSKLDAIAADVKNLRDDVRELREQQAQGNPVVRGLKKLGHAVAP
jgi:peptidoglycan hydrolase CwlO-like protein